MQYCNEVKKNKSIHIYLVSASLGHEHNKHEHVLFTRFLFIVCLVCKFDTNQSN